MPTNITGSYYGGRRPLTYNLMPGQFRNSRASIFPSQTIINNNIGFGGCYDYGNYDCCGGSNKKNWFDWTMMGGMLLTGLGNLFTCFWGGGGSKTPAEEEKPLDLTALKSNVKAYKNAYKGICTSAEVLTDGKILANINGKVETYENLDKFKEALETASTGADTGTGTGAAGTGTGKGTGTGAAGTGTGKGTGTGAAGTGTGKGTGAEWTQLLTEGSIEGVTSKETEETYFKNQTGQEPYTITANSDGITINTVCDKGNGTKKTVNVNITSAQINELLNGSTGTVNLTAIGDKSVTARKLGSYLQLQIGNQTYIVGKDMNAYQFENGNVTGYYEYNWRGQQS